MKRNSVNLLNTNFSMLLFISWFGLLATCVFARNAESADKKSISTLEQLAASRFPNLSECEKNFLRNAQVGEVAFCGPSHSQNDRVPDAGSTSRQQYDVRAELIRWLCVDPAANRLVDPRGAGVYAARIVGQLDLSLAVVPFPIAFDNSRFIANINLFGSQLVALNLSGSQTLEIDADTVTIKQKLALNDGFSANGRVSLFEANLGGDFDANGGQFKNPGNIALDADGLTAKAVFFTNGFSADGEVRIIGASLNGDLNANGGEFKNPGNIALYADGLTAKAVFITDGFNAEGQVRLVGASLNADLNAYGGQFKNPGKVALAADRLHATSVFLQNGFDADGEVNLQLRGARKTTSSFSVTF
jgi:hypothetical protein